jgi:hypothetical protein
MAMANYLARPMSEDVAQEPEINPELLDEAWRQLGDVTADEAISEALQLLVQERLKRRAALQHRDYSVLDKGAGG